MITFLVLLFCGVFRLVRTLPGEKAAVCPVYVREADL